MRLVVPSWYIIDGILDMYLFVAAWLMLGSCNPALVIDIIVLTIMRDRWIPQLVALGRVYDTLDDTQRELIRARHLTSNILHRRYIH